MPDFFLGEQNAIVEIAILADRDRPFGADAKRTAASVRAPSAIAISRRETKRSNAFGPEMRASHASLTLAGSGGSSGDTRVPSSR